MVLVGSPPPSRYFDSRRGDLALVGLFRRYRNRDGSVDELSLDHGVCPGPALRYHLTPAVDRWTGSGLGPLPGRVSAHELAMIMTIALRFIPVFEEGSKIILAQVFTWG